MSSERLDRLLTSKQIATETGISRSTIYRLLQNGAFPKPVRIGPRCTRWPESDIRQWLAERKASGEEKDGSGSTGDARE